MQTAPQIYFFHHGVGSSWTPWGCWTRPAFNLDAQETLINKNCSKSCENNFISGCRDKTVPPPPRPGGGPALWKLKVCSGKHGFGQCPVSLAALWLGALIICKAERQEASRSLQPGFLPACSFRLGCGGSSGGWWALQAKQPPKPRGTKGSKVCGHYQLRPEVVEMPVGDKVVPYVGPGHRSYGDLYGMLGGSHWYTEGGRLYWDSFDCK